MSSLFAQPVQRHPYPCRRKGEQPYPYRESLPTTPASLMGTPPQDSQAHDASNQG